MNRSAAILAVAGLTYPSATHETAWHHCNPLRPGWLRSEFHGERIVRMNIHGQAIVRAS
ncbi:MAG: hypothetical protein L0Z50_35705 [Verrucomicrobiales bacterium]|nr:hypothetical protein [Verrucomicrobiales bacterium]